MFPTMVEPPVGGARERDVKFESFRKVVMIDLGQLA